jgi:outer membrane lipoprotein carrier protein
MPAAAPRSLRIGLVLAFLVSCIGVARGVGAGADDLLARLRSSWGAMTAMSARFEQRQDFAGFDEPLLSTGSLKLLRPSFFEMSFDPPNRQVQVCDGSVVWTYTEANRQVIRSPLSAEATRSADLLDWTLAGATAIAATPDTTFGPGAIRIELRPGPQLPLADLRVWVRGEKPDLLGYEATDTDGNRTRLRLVEVKPAKGLKPADFRFLPPKGVEVIDMGTDGR